MCFLVKYTLNLFSLFKLDSTTVIILFARLLKIINNYIFIIIKRSLRSRPLASLVGKKYINHCKENINLQKFQITIQKFSEFYTFYKLNNTVNEYISTTKN